MVHCKEEHSLSREYLHWDQPQQHEDKFVASGKSVSCRMCGRSFGTIHSREQHERQDHHFTASQRGNPSSNKPFAHCILGQLEGTLLEGEINAKHCYISIKVLTLRCKFTP